MPTKLVIALRANCPPLSWLERDRDIVCFCSFTLNCNSNTFEKLPFLIETMYRKEKYCLYVSKKIEQVVEKRSSVESCCATLDSVDTPILDTVTELLDFIETFIRAIRAF